MAIVGEMRGFGWRGTRSRSARCRWQFKSRAVGVTRWGPIGVAATGDQVRVVWSSGGSDSRRVCGAMRAVVITAHGGPEVLRVQERPDPVVGPGEVRIAVKAAGINFADTLARTGLYPDSPKVPCVVGYEVAGTVESIGDGVESVAPGDRVLAGTRFNGQAELVTVPEKMVYPLPEQLSFEEGAAFPVNYATAQAGLVVMAGLRKGERVLIHAAAGGVGISATQIAKRIGAEVFGTASASKHDAIRAQGVDHAIDYRSQDFVEDDEPPPGPQQPVILAEARRSQGVERHVDALAPSDPPHLGPRSYRPETSAAFRSRCVPAPRARSHRCPGGRGWA